MEQSRNPLHISDITMVKMQSLLAASRSTRCNFRYQRQRLFDVVQQQHQEGFDGSAIRQRCQQLSSFSSSYETINEVLPLHAWKTVGNDTKNPESGTPINNKTSSKFAKKQYEHTRLFSTTAEENVESQPPDSQSTGESMVGILEQESNPKALFESLGMDEEDLYRLAAKSPTPLKLVDMYKYAHVPDEAQRLRNAQFLHRELPIRIAQRAVDLMTLPYGLSDAIPIRQVACAYISYLHRMLSTPMPQTNEDEYRFTDFLQSLVLDRSSIPMAIARGLADWRKDVGDVEVKRLQQMEEALYRFFTARVGLRFLTEHHVLSCHRESAKALRNVTCMFPEEDDSSGCIHSGLDLVHEVNRVAQSVETQTKEFYGFSPEIEVVDCKERKGSSDDFTYVPHHLHYMMGELLKNSCRATVRKYLASQHSSEAPAMGALSRATANRPDLPPIKVVVVKGDEDVTIKIADKGGGIPRSRMSKIWTFAHSTADAEESASAFGTDSLSGLKIRGFGLPLCRIYARYLGGDLTLKSMEGYGLDAYLFLPRLGEACENLPSLVQNSPGELDSLPNLRATTKFKGARSFSSIPASQKRDPECPKVLVQKLKSCTSAEEVRRRIFDFLKSHA